jgi:hypothetical protein
MRSIPYLQHPKLLHGNVAGDAALLFCQQEREISVNG